MTLRLAALLGIGGLLAGVVSAGNHVGERARVSFAREVRPILSDQCFACHGPDAAAREAGLRLDTFDGATAELGDGRRAVVPGAPEASVLLERVLAHDVRDRMPPARTGKQLRTDEVEVLRRWISQGADYETHWAFVAPERPALPDVRDDSWPRNPIDRFVLAHLDAVDVPPAPEADPETLLRRVTVDLTGLPPSIEELDAFLVDPSNQAYEHAVDRLLASPRYAEHMARFWLDAARYGDTHGLHLDNERSLWRWRDEVIASLDRNVPYDRFVLEQLAGDLLPDATLETRIASGFNRNNPTTGEGGLIAEEYLAKYAMDRVDTFGTVFLGLTISCAQCHDHKFDPVSQAEYYSLFAYFDSLDEVASDENALAPPPSMRAPDAALASEIELAAQFVAAARARLEEPIAEVDAQQMRWEERERAEALKRWHVLEPVAAVAQGGAVFETLEDGSALVRGTNPATDVYSFEFETELESITALRLEALAHAAHPLGGAGRAPNANFVLTEVELEHAPLDGSAERVSVPLVRAEADHSQPDFDVTRALDGDNATGWAISARVRDHAARFHPAEAIGHEGGTRLFIRLRFESQYPQHALGRPRVSVTADPALVPGRASGWHMLGPFQAKSGDEAFATDFVDAARIDMKALVSHGDLSLRWTARPDFRDGAVHALSKAENAVVYLTRTIDSPTARAYTLSLGSDDSIRVWWNGELVLANRVARAAAPDQERLELRAEAGENRIVLAITNDRGGFDFYYRVAAEALGSMPLALERALVEPEPRSETARMALRDRYRRNHWSEGPALVKELEQRAAELALLEERAPMTLVSRERAERRETRVLLRGQYDQLGAPVTPGVPAALHALPRDAPADRLGLARWVVDPANPLTARVTVNAHWQRFFGAGLVTTPEDFGAQGAFPSHPELLDWLALELQSTWDLEALHRSIVTSATYRQDARARPELVERDPENLLLARGPRFRMDAEVIRDAALFVSGLLVEEIGGKSVKPYQPPGLWEAVAYPSSNTAKYVQDEGAALYRRSLYTFWKRTAPPPSLSTFDAPDREFCVVERARTNTPLQALVLMNDVQFVEAARALAERVFRAEPSDAERRASLAFRLATSRTPDSDELAVLLDVVDAARTHFAAEPASASALLQVGASPVDAGLDATELAAWTVLTNLILNLDETLTRG